MYDKFTGENVDVRQNHTCGPYIMIEPATIGRVEELLQVNGITFTLEASSDACMGNPEAAVIEFSKDADIKKIQQVLDSVQ